MRFILTMILFFQSALIAADFDVAIIGTSPEAVREVTAHSALGEKVLIVGEDAHCREDWMAYANLEVIDEKLDGIYIDSRHHYVELIVGCRHYTTEKLLIAPTGDFPVYNGDSMQNVPSRDLLQLEQGLIEVLENSS